MIEKDNKDLSIERQCELLGLSRSCYYYEPKPESDYNKMLKVKIEEKYSKHPFFGSRRMSATLKRDGECVGRKRVGSLMKELGVFAIYPKRKLSKAEPSHKKYPYLLKDVEITRPDQAWATDITYIRIPGGYIYLTAIIDLYSRYVLSWKISNTQTKELCIDTLRDALRSSIPEISNSDQGSQYTSKEYVNTLKENGVKVSMDGVGRVFDNIFIERLWRSVKYEEVYIKRYESIREATESLREYFEFYNNERPHQSLGYRTPAEVYAEYKNSRRAA